MATASSLTQSPLSWYDLAVEDSVVEKQRIARWDNIKFILIFLVVLGHMVDQDADLRLFQGVYAFIYAFHMPLFFFISGLFHKNEYVAQKFCTYVGIGYIYKFVLFSVRSLMGEEVELHLFRETGTPWFLFALGAFVVLTWLFRDVNPWYLMLIFVLIACFMGYDSTVGSKFVLSRIFYFYPYFLLGTVTDRRMLEHLAQQARFRIVGVLVILLWVLACGFFSEDIYTLCVLFKGVAIEEEALVSGIALMRMTCYGLAFVLGFSVICLVPTRKIPFVTVFGQRTLQVYFWHRPILYILVDSGLVIGLWESAGGIALYLFGALVLTYLLSFRVFSFPTQTIQWFGRSAAQERES